MRVNNVPILHKRRQKRSEKQKGSIIFTLSFFAVTLPNIPFFTTNCSYRYQMGPMNLLRIFWVPFLISFSHKLKEWLLPHMFLIYKKRTVAISTSQGFHDVSMTCYILKLLSTAKKLISKIKSVIFLLYYNIRPSLDIVFLWIAPLHILWEGLLWSYSVCFLEQNKIWRGSPCGGREEED